MSVTSREVHLVRRPDASASKSNFAVVDATLDSPAEGQLLIRNEWMSVDPAMRNMMNDASSYIAPFELNEPMTGGAVGTVIESRSPTVAVGATVHHNFGWREHALVDAASVHVVDTTDTPAEEYLNALSMIGLTAWIGLTEIAPVKSGDVVFVSGAAGAVGSIAGMIARNLGASKVIGSAGGPEKGRSLTEDFGYDAAIDYRAGKIRRQLATAAPDGIDVYFDNVGGEHLQASLSALRDHGRVALCGAISQYNVSAPLPGPNNLSLAIRKRLSLRGFIVLDHMALFPAYVSTARSWLADGSLRTRSTVVDGIENAPGALLGLFAGENTGKMLVKL